MPAPVSFRRACCRALGLLLALLCAPPGHAQAQPSAAPPPGAPVQTARAEIKLESYNSEVHVQALAADSSVVLLVGQDPRHEPDRQFTFQHYDQHLRLRRERPAPVPSEYRHARSCAEGLTVYALFRSTTHDGRLLALAYDARSGAVRSQEFDTRLSREIVDLKALDGRLFANVLLADGQHVTALLLDVPTGRFQYLPAVYEPLPTQLSFATDAPRRRAEYIVSQTNGRKSRLLLKQVSADGGLLLRAQYVQAENERSLITAQLAPPAPDDAAPRLLAGTYSLRDPTYAQGLFVTDLGAAAENQRTPLRFYDFLNLKHFFDYLSPGRQARLRRRIERRAASAAPPLRWHYRLLLHELLPQPGGGHVLVAEAYFPHYRYNGYGYGPAGRTGALGPSPYGLPGSRVFDGYQTTHVLVCGFDAKGALAWDNVFVVGDLRRDDLEEAVRVQPLPDGRLALAYLDDEHIRYKLIDRATPGPDDLRVPLQTNGPNTPEKIAEAEQTDLLPWFGSCFVASGYQRIRPGGSPERQVFFLNAVVF